MPLAWRALGDSRTHSSSRARVRWRASTTFDSRGHAVELLLQPAGVVAREGDAAAAIELQDPLGHVVEEVAVVGDGHHGARVFLEEALQPLDRLGVEVVGGLVEQQQVRMLEQQPAERHAALLAARQDGHLGVVGRAAQRVHGDVDVALKVPGVGRRDVVLERALFGADGLVVGVRVGPLRHHGVVSLDERLDLVHAVKDVALDVLGRVELGFLAQIADREAGRQAGLATEAVVEAGHDAQQARLAGAVGPDDPDLGAGVEGDGDVLQHRPVGRVVAGKLVRGVDEFSGHAQRVTASCRSRRRWPMCRPSSACREQTRPTTAGCPAVVSVGRSSCQREPITSDDR